MRLSDFENIELDEAPLADFGVHGDANNAGSYAASDVKAFHNEKWLKKVNAHFEKCPFNFNVYLYNAPGGKYHPYKNDQGEKDTANSETSIKRLMDGVLSQQDVNTLERMMGAKLPPSNTAITFIMSDNEGDEKVGLTPWILVHRLVHGLLGRTPQSHVSLSVSQGQVIKHATNLVDAIEHIYGNDAQTVYKFKSARDGKISRKGEFIVELFTQYIVQGKVSLNLPQIRSPFNDDGSLYLGAWDTGQESDDSLHRADHSKNPLFPKILKAYQKVYKDVSYADSHTDRENKETILKMVIGKAPRVQRQSSYNVYHNDELIASTGNPERYEGKEGYRIEQTFDATPENIAKQQAKQDKWFDKKDQIEKEFDEIFWDINSAISHYKKVKEGRVSLESYLSELNEALESHLSICVGKYFMISGR